MFYLTGSFWRKNKKLLLSQLKPGEVILMENLSFIPRRKLADENFAKELASLADYYVNDAFATSHREHASTATIAKFFPKKKFFGLLLQMK